MNIDSKKTPLEVVCGEGLRRREQGLRSPLGHRGGSSEKPVSTLKASHWNPFPVIPSKEGNQPVLRAEFKTPIGWSLSRSVILKFTKATFSQSHVLCLSQPGVKGHSDSTTAIPGSQGTGDPAPSGSHPSFLEATEDTCSNSRLVLQLNLWVTGVGRGAPRRSRRVSCSGVAWLHMLGE